MPTRASGPTPPHVYAPPREAHGHLHAHLRVADLWRAIAFYRTVRGLRRAAAHGHPVTTGRDAAGAPSGSLRDPDGHTVALYVHPAAPGADPDERSRTRATHLLEVLKTFG